METEIPEKEVNNDGKYTIGKKKPQGADFEEAVEATGFGFFNYIFCLLIFPCVTATFLEPSTMSFIMPSAKCDLNLTLSDKGLLNAITFMGMISTAIIWGLISDAMGRKKCLVVGYFLSFLCVVGAATSQHVAQLMVFKFLGGAVISGPFSIFISYFSEFHSKKFRPRIMMFNGICLSVANLILPLLAIAILPKEWNLVIAGYKLKSWQILLLTTAIPSLISAIALCFLPESPKFLMFKGRNEEAMAALQTMYSLNTWKSKEDYPIKTLVNELPDDIGEENYKVSRAYSLTSAIIPAIHVKKSKIHSLLGAMWQQSKPLFQSPYLILSLQMYLLNFLVYVGQNTVRLWVPDLFATINEYTVRVGNIDSMCDVLEYNVASTAASSNSTLGACDVFITVDTYFNNIIVALTNILGYLAITIVVNFCDIKIIILCALLVDIGCGIGLYFATSPAAAVATASVYTACGSIAAVSLLSASVNLFPTSVRTLLLSFSLIIGRLGGIAGNLALPLLIQQGCIQPFIMITVAMIACFILTVFLPNSKKINLK